MRVLYNHPYLRLLQPKVYTCVRFAQSNVDVLLYVSKHSNRLMLGILRLN